MESQGMKYLGKPVTHFVIVEFHNFPYICLRNESGQYLRNAIITSCETPEIIMNIAKSFASGNPIPIVDLGVLKYGKFESQQVSEPFLSEADKLTQAILRDAHALSL